MLRTEVNDQLQLNFEQTIALLGVKVIWRQTKDPQATAELQAGARIVGRNDAELVNAIGIGGRILTVRVGDLPAAPAKFDLFELPDGRAYTANAVHPVLLSDRVIGFKVMCRGHQ